MIAEERMEKLEKELKRIRKLNNITLAVLLIAILLSATITFFAVAGRGEGMIKAEGFIVVDEEGRERAHLFAGPFGEPELAFLDPNGEQGSYFDYSGLTIGNELAGAKIYAAESGVSLNFYDGSVKSRIRLGIDEIGPWLGFYDTNGKCRSLLDLMEKGPKLDFFDENGKIRLELVSDKIGTGFGMVDDNNNVRIGIGVNQNGPRLYLSDSNDQDRLTLGVWSGKTPDGKTIIYPESTILMFNKDNKIIWEAPNK